MSEGAVAVVDISVGEVCRAFHDLGNESTDLCQGDGGRAESTAGSDVTTTETSTDTGARDGDDENDDDNGKLAASDRPASTTVGQRIGVTNCMASTGGALGGGIKRGRLRRLGRPKTDRPKPPPPPTRPQGWTATTTATKLGEREPDTAMTSSVTSPSSASVEKSAPSSEDGDDPRLFDSHCHLDRLLERVRRTAGGDPPAGGRGSDWREAFDRFVADRDSDFGPGFEGCITVFCHPGDFAAGHRGHISSLLTDPRVFAALGVHPLLAKAADSRTETELRQCLVDMDKAVAVGECGLDFHGPRKSAASEAVQVRVFGLQLHLAKELNKAVVLHVRDADERAFAIMQEGPLPANWPIHMHCFSESWERCSRWTHAFPGMKFGFTPDYFDPEVVRNLPLEKILLETDAPYFLPKAVSKAAGDRNGSLGRPGFRGFSHPGYVLHTAMQVAAVKGASVGDVLRANRQNVREIYGV